MKNFTALFSILVICVLTIHTANAQTAPGAQFTGDLETNTSFFIRDSAIGAAGTPQYDRQKSSNEVWLNLNSSVKGFDFGVRFDMYNNSNLLDPRKSYSAVGIGRFHVKKTVEGLGITAGYFYDQIGSGIIYRSYEARYLGIDNSLAGLRLNYDFGPNWKVKAFAGKQKKMEGQSNLLEFYQPLIVGGSIDGFMKIGSDSSKMSFSPGFGILKRTLDDESMNSLLSNINTDSIQYRFVPKYNVYSATAYYTLAIKKFSWYVEGAYKTKEAVPNPKTFGGAYLNRDGSVLYTTLSYATEGLGVNLAFKRTDNFFLRTSPLERLNHGQIAFLPPLQRLNTYRLTSRYNSVTQEFGEYAFSIDVQYEPIEHLDFELSYSSMSSLTASTQTIATDPDLFRELVFEGTYKWRKNMSKLTLGLQWQKYNQEVYEFHPDAPVVHAITPYMEYVHKFNRKKSIRFELQYMNTQQDLGSWAFVLAEYSIAPHWTFTAANLLNVDPRTYGVKIANASPVFYPTLAIFYTHKSNRFSFSFVKQPQGVVCTGGICRVEPAFSGVRFGVMSRF